MCFARRGDPLSAQPVTLFVQQRRFRRPLLRAQPTSFPFTARSRTGVMRSEINVDDRAGIIIDDGEEIEWMRVEIGIWREARVEETLLQTFGLWEARVVAY